MAPTQKNGRQLCENKKKEIHMGILNMAKTIKKIHPDFLVLYKQGVFYHAYGKDSYIISAIFDYMLKTQQNVATCGFSERSRLS